MTLPFVMLDIEWPPPLYFIPVFLIPRLSGPKLVYAVMLGLCQSRLSRPNQSARRACADTTSICPSRDRLPPLLSAFLMDNTTHGMNDRRQGRWMCIVAAVHPSPVMYEEVCTYKQAVYRGILYGGIGPAADRRHRDEREGGRWRGRERERGGGEEKKKRGV
ncbi:hypothetical protein LY76DRAFT_587757 [Colletotrichum caudatum]|nr:hypothetical protein LY76DRAFT_587757 [Colletotrichum caudatum]